MKFPEAMEYLNVTATGSSHSGIDDARNLARLAMHLIAKGEKLNKITHWLV